MLLLALLASAQADEVVLRNDTNYTDTYDTSDSVVWLEFPECAVSVLTPDPDDLPMDIHTIQIYLGSSQGNQDGQDAMVAVGIQQLEDGEDPSGRGDWAWNEEAFYITVSSQTINELSLDNIHEGLFPLTVSEGSIAVWICAPDPDWGYDWPMTNAVDTSGIVMDRESPSAGTWLYWNYQMYEMSDLGYDGSWIIRAIAGEGGSSGGSSGGSGDSGGSDDSGDSGGSGGSGGGTDTSGGGWDTGEDSIGDVQILSITPDTTNLGEGLSVAVVGSGFHQAAQLTIGGLPASNVIVSGDAAITATSPSGLPAGIHDVLVTNPDGESATLSEAFEVLDTGESEGCGCSSSKRSGSGLGVLLLLGLLGWGRRRSQERD